MDDVINIVHYDIYGNITNPQDRKELLYLCDKYNIRETDKVLPIAVEYADTKMVELLLKSGANVEAVNTKKQGSTSLMIASRLGLVKMVILLLKYGANIETRDCCGSKALHYASRHGRDDVVRLLLNPQIDGVAGAHVNARNFNRHTPLHYALRRSHNVKVVASLLEYGADMNIKNHNNKTFLELGNNIGYIKEVIDQHLLRNNGSNIKPAKR